MFLDRFLFGLNRLGVGRAVALDECELTVFVLGSDNHLFHSSVLLRP